MKESWVPLSSGFMATSIIGFFVALWAFDWSTNGGLTWGFTFMLFFLIMFFASIISMTKAEPIPEHMEELAIHEHYKHRTREAEFKGLLNKLSEGPKEKNHIIWQDFVLLLYAAFYVYYIAMALSYPAFIATSILAIPFFVLTGVIIIWMIIDAITSEKLGLLGKTVFTLVMIIFGGLGVFIYYIFRRMNNSLGK